MGQQQGKKGWALVGALLMASPVAAHEFWIEPVDFSTGIDTEIQADLRVGQNFKGDAFPYIPSRFSAFKSYDRLGEQDVAGIAGNLLSACHDATHAGPDHLHLCFRR